jgi:hypothetical protein
MSIHVNDRRWKTAATKEGGAKLTKEQMIERLFEGADRFFASRVQLRADQDMLQDAYDDATGLVVQDMYANPLVKETKDALYALDHAIGNAARRMEHLARDLKKSASKRSP